MASSDLIILVKLFPGNYMTIYTSDCAAQGKVHGLSFFSQACQLRLRKLDHCTLSERISKQIRSFAVNILN